MNIETKVASSNFFILMFYHCVHTRTLVLLVLKVLIKLFSTHCTPCYYHSLADFVCRVVLKIFVYVANTLCIAFLETVSLHIISSTVRMP